MEKSVQKIGHEDHQTYFLFWISSALPFWIFMTSTTGRPYCCIQESCLLKIVATIFKMAPCWKFKSEKGRALKSHALSMRLTQTNAILRSHAKTIISHTVKVFYLKGSFWGRKLLLKLSDCLMNHEPGNNSLHAPLVPASNTFQQRKFSCRASLSEWQHVDWRNSRYSALWHVNLTSG